jgi:hypothetical protein
MDDKTHDENGLSYLDEDPLIIEIKRIDAEIAKINKKDGVTEIINLDDALQSLHAPAQRHETEVRVEAQAPEQTAHTQGRSMRR